MTATALAKGTTSIALIIALTAHGLFVKLHVGACPIKGLTGNCDMLQVCSPCSHCRQRCQLARHSDLSSYSNMFVSRMQMPSSQCLHGVLDSTRCV